MYLWYLKTDVNKFCAKKKYNKFTFLLKVISLWYSIYAIEINYQWKINPRFTLKGYDSIIWEISWKQHARIIFIQSMIEWKFDLSILSIYNISYVKRIKVCQRSIHLRHEWMKINILLCKREITELIYKLNMLNFLNGKMHSLSLKVHFYIQFVPIFIICNSSLYLCIF